MGSLAGESSARDLELEELGRALESELEELGLAPTPEALRGLIEAELELAAELGP